MPTGSYWWYVYGYFDVGEEHLPHLGQVIRYYRQLAGIEKETLAQCLVLPLTNPPPVLLY